MTKHSLAFCIPPHIAFSDLKLSREPDGDVSFDLDVIKALCEANNISCDVFLNSPEDNLSTLLVNWYAEHINGDGEPDTIAEDLIAETQHGGGVSHTPGRA
jgi:hypothetical protein